MKLFNELMKHEREFPAQFKPLLMRLSVMEGGAASKLIHNKPVYDPDRERQILENIRIKCLVRCFSQSRIDIVQEFFKNNMSIAKLIQEAFIKECHNKSNDEVLSDAITSISKVTNLDINKETLLTSIRVFIDGLAETVIQNIECLYDDHAYDLLRGIIENCFAHIDKIQLTEAMNNLKVEMAKYQKMIMSEREDTIQTKNHSLLQRRSVNNSQTEFNRNNVSFFQIKSQDPLATSTFNQVLEHQESSNVI